MSTAGNSFSRSCFVKTLQQPIKARKRSVGNFLNVPKRQSCLKLTSVVNNFYSFGAWNDFTDVKHKLNLRLVCTHLNSTYISCAVHSLCMKMINYKPWTKSEATALLIIFVWKENHTAELALCVYIHYEFILRPLLGVDLTALERKYCVNRNPETREISKWRQK